MKEFVEKLIGRLEEYKYSHLVEHNKERLEHCTENERAEHCEGIDCFWCVWEKSIEIVNQLAEEYNNGWISVSDRLPETNESVLCWAKSTARGGDVCFVGSYHKGFWFLQSSANTHSFPGQYKIVAWQPLPAPFKKGE